MIDLHKYIQTTTAVVPIKDDQFQFQRKKYFIKYSRNGWFWVEMNGNLANPLERAYDFNVNPKHIVNGYIYNNKIIFQNFDVAKRKWKLEISAELYFNNSQTFTSVKAIYWEDKKLYFFQPNYTDYKILELKSAFDNEQSIENIKGVTPELRTVYLFHKIQRDQIKAFQEAQRKEEEREAFMKTIPGRLQLSFESAGAVLVNYSITGNRAVVDWKVKDGEYSYNSVINLDTFMIEEAGYCLSGDDKRHNVTSIVKTAENYENEGLTYITRNRR